MFEGLDDRFHVDDAGRLYEGPEHGCIYDRSAQHFFGYKIGIDDSHPVIVQYLLGNNVYGLGVDHHQPVFLQTGCDFDNLEKAGIEDNNYVRFRNISPDADLLVADSDESLDRGTPAFGAESWKCLRKFSFGNCGLGY